MRCYKDTIRLFFCYSLCLFFLCYTFYGAITIKHKNKPTFTDIFSETPQNEQKNEESSVSKVEESQVSTNTDTNTSTELSESVPVSAEAVKGKIITRYISPYAAPQSYNGVYLKNSSGIEIDLKKIVNQKIKFKIQKNKEPQVLIMHTHATEQFMEKNTDYYTESFNARSTDNSKNMTKIGSIIAEKLNSSGIETIHDKTHHDYPEYTGSYGRSAATVKEYLKKYPNIKVVLDLHRDSISEENGKAKLVTEINGKKAAQIMLVMGSQSGSIENHENWQENLSLAAKLHQVIETKYPTLARPILLRSSLYNQNLTTGSMLIEFGTEVNTLEEATYSAELVADSLLSLFNTL